MVSMRRAARNILAAAALLCCAHAAQAAVLGIDYGSEYVKVSIVAPGRTPISIVINEISKRKSTAAVSFTGGDRWLMEEAMNYNARFPERVFTRMRDLLGKQTAVPAFQEYLAKYRLPYTVVADPTRGTARVVAQGGVEYAVEELVAMVLQYAMKIGESMGKGQIKDAVIAVPPYFGQTHRYALYDAADIAGLNILAEVSDLSCAALQWGIDKEFNPNGTWTIIYDMGATSVGAALVRYSSFESKEAGKKKTNGQFEIKAVKWDASTGGEDMDMLLLDHFLAEFDAKHKPVVAAADAPKAIGKLRKQVRKTKEILSANKEAPLSVEGMHEDVDFRSTIHRDKFEEMATAVGLFERAVAPLKAIIALLPDFNITLEDIHAVEVIGGATRVPGVKTALVAAMGGRELDQHLDSDESVAMGAGLFAANMSTTFRMRKFGAADAAPYSFQVDLGQADKPEHKVLLPLYKRFPVRRIVSIPNATDNVFFTVYHNATAGPLPPGITVDKVADFNITGVPEAADKYNVTGKINAHFAVDNSGLMFMEKAEYQVDVVDMVEVPPPVKETPKVKPPPKTPPKTSKTTIPDQSANGGKGAVGADDADDAGAAAGGAGGGDTKEAAADADAAEEVEKPAARRLLEDEDASEVTAEGKDEGEVPADVTADPDALAADDASAADGNGTDADGNATATPAEPKMRQRRRVFRIPLNVAETGRAVPPMTPDDITASIAVLKELATKDEEKRRQEAAKSNLEAYIYSIRDKVAEDEDLRRVTDEAQRETFSEALTEAEDWLYSDGPDSTAEVFNARKAALQDVGDEWITRAKELERRPDAVAKARDFVDLAHKTVEMFNSTKPWISEEEKETLLANVSTFVTWLDDKVAAQEGKALTEAPAFSAAEVGVELRPLEGKLAKLKKKAAPKPPPPPPAANKTDADANATAADADAAPDVEADSTPDVGADVGVGEEGGASAEKAGEDGAKTEEEVGAGSAGEKDHTELRH